LGNKEEREERKKWWYKMRREAWEKMDDEFKRRFLNVFRLHKEDTIEERNDVYIYKTLRYPPNSSPPTAE
jgi:hypothetical protein